MEGASGVEVVFPYEVANSPLEMRALLEKYDLDVAALNVNIKAEPEFRDGSLSAKDPAARARAIQFRANP